jgi:hypothetical protein
MDSEPGRHQLEESLALATLEAATMMAHYEADRYSQPSHRTGEQDTHWQTELMPLVMWLKSVCMLQRHVLKR